jgi:hypothetical protein
MPFDDLYQNDTNAAINAMDLRPAAPAQNQRSAWSAPWRAVKAAAADVAGSMADLGKSYAAASAMTLESDPIARQTMDPQYLHEGAEEGRRQISTGEAMTSEIGQVARNYSRSLRPDPMTAGTAEKVIFGVMRPVSKLVAGGMLAGPFGIVGAAGEEGLTTSDDLRAEGVDFATRAKIGSLTAGVTAATAFAPLAGPTLRATAALYVAGGPGAFMAQQAATRAILEHANYPDLAKQYDPLDPVGLAVSALIPLPFAAHGAMRVAGSTRGSVTPVHAPDGVVDAALTHNLTVQADQHAAIDPVLAGTEMADNIARERAPQAVPRETATAIERNTVRVVKKEDGSLDVEATLANLPPVADGEVRLFRGESPTSKFSDVFNPEALTRHRASDIPGQRYSTELSVADYYRDAYDENRDASIHYIDVPEAVAEHGRVSDDEIKVDLNAVNQRRARGDMTPPPKRAADTETPSAAKTASALDQNRLTGAEAPPGAVKADPVQQVVHSRVSQLEAFAGDMPVRVDDAGKTATVSDEIARIKQEVNEGTDTELGHQDADLLRVAAECALSLS